MPCDLNELRELSTCFSNKCMGDSTRESINLYIALAFLKSQGGTDYTEALSLLEIDSKQWERLAVSDRDAITTYINLQFAVANHAEFPGGTSTSNLKALSRCIQCLGSEQRKSMLAYVWCQIANTVVPDNVYVIGGEGEGDVIIGGEGGEMIGAEQ